MIIEESSILKFDNIAVERPEIKIYFNVNWWHHGWIAEVNGKKFTSGGIRWVTDCLMHANLITFEQSEKIIEKTKKR